MGGPPRSTRRKCSTMAIMASDNPNYTRWGISGPLKWRYVSNIYSHISVVNPLKFCPYIGIHRPYIYIYIRILYIYPQFPGTWNGHWYTFTQVSQKERTMNQQEWLTLAHLRQAVDEDLPTNISRFLDCGALRQPHLESYNNQSPTMKGWCFSKLILRVS